MKKSLFLLLILTIVYTKTYNPCEDETYIGLKKKQLDEMSDREYDYFSKVDQECKSYLRKNINKSKDLSTTTTKAPVNKLNATYRGPRFGLSLVTGDVADELNSPIISQFGWQEEIRVFGNEGQAIGLMEFIGLVGGMEQGYLLPSLTTAIGYRKPNGFEAGFGPNLSITGVGYALALGFSIQKGGLVFPQNISLVFSESSFRISYITGFNSYSTKKWW